MAVFHCPQIFPFSLLSTHLPQRFEIMKSDSRTLDPRERKWQRNCKLTLISKFSCAAVAVARGFYKQTKKKCFGFALCIYFLTSLSHSSQHTKLSVVVTQSHHHNKSWMKAESGGKVLSLWVSVSGVRAEGRGGCRCRSVGPVQGHQFHVEHWSSRNSKLHNGAQKPFEIFYPFCFTGTDKWGQSEVIS